MVCVDLGEVFGVFGIIVEVGVMVWFNKCL